MKGDRWFVEMMGSGAALFDYDDDGDLDLFLVQSGSLEPGERAAETGDRLYRNDLAAGAVRFVDVTAESGIVESGYGMGVATGDYDGDGRVDLYVTNWGANELWRNRGGGAFERRGAAAAVDDPRWGVASGLLRRRSRRRARPLRRQLRRLLAGDAQALPLGARRASTTAARSRSRRSRTCSTATAATGPSPMRAGDAGLRAAPPLPALGALAGDFDADGWLDLYVANDQTAELPVARHRRRPLRRGRARFRLRGRRRGQAASEHGSDCGRRRRRRRRGPVPHAYHRGAPHALRQRRQGRVRGRDHQQPAWSRPPGRTPDSASAGSTTTAMGCSICCRRAAR